MKVIKNPRQQQIMNMLNENEVVSVSDLSEKLNSSCMTIRRDLEYLEQKGIVRRIHGAAVLVKTEHFLPSFTERIERCESEKTAIGKAAMSFISPQSVVCFDAGTTTLAIVQHIPEDLHFTAITTGLMTASALCRFPRLEIIQVGGTMHHSSYTACSLLAKDFLKQFNADVAFISTRAVNAAKGIFEWSMDLVEEKRALVSIAKKVVLLVDHTKFEGRSLCQAVPLEKIDVIITDDKVSPDIVRQLEENGKEVIVAKPEI